MTQVNIDKPIFDSLNNKKSKDRAQEVFNKLLAKHKKGRNAFDEMRTQSYPSINMKLGGHLNDTV